MAVNPERFRLKNELMHTDADLHVQLCATCSAWCVVVCVMFSSLGTSKRLETFSAQTVNIMIIRRGLGEGKVDARCSGGSDVSQNHKRTQSKDSKALCATCKRTRSPALCLMASIESWTLFSRVLSGEVLNVKRHVMCRKCSWNFQCEGQSQTSRVS